MMLVNGETIKVTDALLKHHLRHLSQCEACGIYGEKGEFTESFFGMVCSMDCLSSLHSARSLPTSKYKCESCTQTVTISAVTPRQPHCPTCSSHPAMYPLTEAI